MYAVGVLLDEILLFASNLHLGECDLALHAEIEGARRAFEGLAFDSKSKLQKYNEQQMYLPDLVEGRGLHCEGNETCLCTGSHAEVDKRIAPAYGDYGENCDSTSGLKSACRAKKAELKSVTNKGSMGRVS